MSTIEIENLREKAERYGGGVAGWKKSLRESAAQMVKEGRLHGILTDRFHHRDEKEAAMTDARRQRLFCSDIVKLPSTFWLVFWSTKKDMLDVVERFEESADGL